MKHLILFLFLGCFTFLSVEASVMKTTFDSDRIEIIDRTEHVSPNAPTAETSLNDVHIYDSILHFQLAIIAEESFPNINRQYIKDQRLWPPIKPILNYRGFREVKY